MLSVHFFLQLWSFWTEVPWVWTSLPYLGHFWKRFQVLCPCIGAVVPKLIWAWISSSLFLENWYSQSFEKSSRWWCCFVKEVGFVHHKKNALCLILWKKALRSLCMLYISGSPGVGQNLRPLCSTLISMSVRGRVDKLITQRFLLFEVLIVKDFSQKFIVIVSVWTIIACGGSVSSSYNCVIYLLISVLWMSFVVVVAMLCLRLCHSWIFVNDRVVHSSSLMNEYYYVV